MYIIYVQICEIYVLNKGELRGLSIEKKTEIRQIRFKKSTIVRLKKSPFLLSKICEPLLCALLDKYESKIDFDSVINTLLKKGIKIK